MELLSSARRGFRRIVLTYAIVGAIWILSSDALLGLGLGVFPWAELLKGLLFILVTSILLYLLLARLGRQLASAIDEKVLYRRRLDGIVDSPIVGIAVWHIDGTILEANEALLNLWGYTREQFEKEAPPLSLLSTVENRVTDREWLVAAIRDRGHGSHESLILRRDGATLPVQMGVTSIKDGTEGVLFLLDNTEIVEARDLTRRTLEELEEHVSQRTHELSDANAELQAFTHSLSHDLRSPLRAIDGLAVILEEDAVELGEKGSFALQRIRENVAQMSSLVDAMLKLSNLSRTPMRAEPIDLTELAREIVEEMGASSPTRKVHALVEPGMSITADPTLMKVLLWNLIDNAWKFTSTRSEGRMSICKEGKELVIADNGVGFDPRFSYNLFKPFGRLHPIQEFPGNGVGLAMVDRIVRKHQGVIRAESKPGEGATFRILLPDL